MNLAAHTTTFSEHLILPILWRTHCTLFKPSSVTLSSCVEFALSEVQGLTVCHFDLKVYRLYVVWGKDNRVLYPALLCLAGCIGMHVLSSLLDSCNLTQHYPSACGIGALVSVARASPTTSVFESEPLILALFVMTLVTIFACTSEYRIHCFPRRSPFHEKKNLLQR